MRRSLDEPRSSLAEPENRFSPPNISFWPRKRLFGPRNRPSPPPSPASARSPRCASPRKRLPTALPGPNRPAGAFGSPGCEASRHPGRSGTSGRFSSQRSRASGTSGRFSSRRSRDSDTSGRFSSRRFRVSGTLGRIGSGLPSYRLSVYWLCAPLLAIGFTPCLDKETSQMARQTSSMFDSNSISVA